MKQWKLDVVVILTIVVIVLLLVFGSARADSSISSGTGKITAQAHVDFKIIIPLIVGVNDGKAQINSKKVQLQQTCDSNNVCTAYTL